MVVAFSRILFRLLLTLTLTVCCLAVEGDGQISISFSIWFPAPMDIDIVEEIVSVALRTFLCNDASLILLDANFRNICYQRGAAGETNLFSNIGKMSMLDFIKQTDPVRSYLVAEAADVLISRYYYDINTTQGTTWDVNYEVLQMGSMEMELAKIANATDEMLYMEDRIQQRLNESITEGLMNQRLRGTGIYMGRLGQESEVYLENSLTFEEENTNADPELDYKQSALVMRYIGIVMLVASVSFSATLTYLGRRYRLKKDRKEKMITRETAEQRGLVTEQGVNLMLDIGRRESERMSSSTSTDVYLVHTSSQC